MSIYSYKDKYLKYKMKYLQAKAMVGGIRNTLSSDTADDDQCITNVLKSNQFENCTSGICAKVFTKYGPHNYYLYIDSNIINDIKLKCSLCNKTLLFLNEFNDFMKINSKDYDDSKVVAEGKTGYYYYEDNNSELKQLVKHKLFPLMKKLLLIKPIPSLFNCIKELCNNQLLNDKKEQRDIADKILQILYLNKIQPIYQQIVIEVTKINDLTKYIKINRLISDLLPDAFKNLRNILDKIIALYNEFITYIKLHSCYDNPHPELCSEYKKIFDSFNIGDYNEYKQFLEIHIPELEKYKQILDTKEKPFDYIIEIPLSPNNFKILYLDFDETLGFFHLTVHLFIPAIKNIINEKHHINFTKELLKLCIRPYLKDFFEILKLLKHKKYISEIIIMSRNRNSRLWPTYFIDIITLLHEITGIDKVIDDMILGVTEKDIGNNFIVDDKCEHVIQRKQCIEIKPYICYIDIEKIRTILEYLKVDSKEIEKTITFLTDNEALIKEMYKTQYNIDDVKTLNNLEDQELIQCYNEIIDKYIVDNQDRKQFYFDSIEFLKELENYIEPKLINGKILNDYLYFNNLKFNKYINKYIIYYYFKLIKDTYLNRSCKHKFNFVVNFLTTWQEYYNFFYLCIKMIKSYISDSVIISIGESPSKFLYTQSLLYSHPKTKEELQRCMFPDNLEFSYFPISRLSFIFYKMYDEDTTLNEDISTRQINDIQDIINKFRVHCKLNKLDPISIIASNKNYIFVDRVEKGRAITAFIYLYSELIKELQPDVRMKFIEKFKIVGFEFILSSEQKLEQDKRIANIEKFIENKFGKNKSIFSFILFDTYLVGAEYYNIVSKKTHPQYFSLYDKLYGNFFESYIIYTAIVNYTTLPENVYGNTRCIKFLNFLNGESNNDILEVSKNKDNTGSKFCNMLNYILYYILIEKNEKILSIIQNIDKINYKKFGYIEYLKIDDLFKNVLNKLYKDFGNYLVCNNDYLVWYINYMLNYIDITIINPDDYELSSVISS